MMTFETSGAYQVATNSVKPVKIARGVTGYWLHLPEGDFFGDKKQMFCYDTFEQAKRHAEENVGIQINLGDPEYA